MLLFRIQTNNPILVLCLIAGLTTLSSCQSRTETDSENEKTILVESSPVFILDTVQLKKLDIQYSRSEEQDNVWSLTVRDTQAKSKEILGAKYFINATPSASEPGASFKVDSIEVYLPNKTHMINLVDWGPYLTSYGELQQAGVRYEDYNFDGIMDISIASNSSGVTNEIREYFIFNKRTRLPDHHLRLANAGFDHAKNLVITRWSGGHAGKIGGTTFSRFSKQDSLIFVKSENQDFHPALDAYIREIKTLLPDGSYSITMDTIPRE